MTVAAGNIQITGTTGRASKAFQVYSELPLFAGELEAIIRKQLPTTKSGTVTSDINVFNYTQDQGTISFMKARAE